MSRTRSGQFALTHNHNLSRSHTSANALGIHTKRLQKGHPAFQSRPHVLLERPFIVFLLLIFLCMLLNYRKLYKRNGQNNFNHIMLFLSIRFHISFFNLVLINQMEWTTILTCLFFKKQFYKRSQVIYFFRNPIGGT